MIAHDLAATTVPPGAPLRLLVSGEPIAPWSARALDVDVPPSSLGDARARRDELRGLLSREQAASVDFLLALADFDRRRGWERLGHASLFAFLTREFRLSKGSAFLRLSAARLLPRHPAVEAALRRGDLCLSAVGELARVLTRENEAAVLPRYFGCSSREAREVSAALLPAQAPPFRDLVTRLPLGAGAESRATAGLPLAPATLTAAPAVVARAEVGIPSHDGAVRAHEPPTNPPARVASQAPRIEPLTADLRRLHLTVSKGFLDKVATAKSGLSHALPGATTEQVLEAALDLLLERQAQRRSLGKKARLKAKSTVAPTARPIPATRDERASSDLEGPALAPPQPAADPRRPHVPADIEREVRLCDGERCQYPLDGGGVCSATWQVELDHIVPVALGGPTTAANLRCACRFHNQAAAEVALGPALMQACRQRRR